MSVTLMRNRFEEEEKSGAEHDDLWHAAVKRERESRLRNRHVGELPWA